jgi:hypothetical protein
MTSKWFNFIALNFYRHFNLLTVNISKTKIIKNAKYLINFAKKLAKRLDLLALGSHALQIQNSFLHSNIF